MKWVIGIALILFIFPGCGKNIKTTLPPALEKGSIAVPEKTHAEPAHPPSWVLKKKRGDGEYFENGAFFAVGKSAGEKGNRNFWASADDRARNNLAGMFRSFQDLLADSFLSTGANIKFSQNAGRKIIPAEIHKVTATLLMAVEIVDHWQDLSEGQLYSLSKLDINKFYERLNHHSSFSRTTRETIKIHSEILIRSLQQRQKMKRPVNQSEAGYETEGRRYYLY